MIPSGKRLHNYGKSPFLIGKSTIVYWQFHVMILDQCLLGAPWHLSSGAVEHRTIPQNFSWTGRIAWNLPGLVNIQKATWKIAQSK
jgi:hypothetical protein